MKIYFTASLTGRKLYLDSYQRIVDELRKQSNDVFADHILDHTESQIKLETVSERNSFQTQLEKWINNSDCMVVESTFPSISVGYEISLAKQRGKPILILYQDGDPPALLNGIDNEHVICEHYTNTTLKETIHSFLEYVKGKADTRFTFFITANQLAHLSQQAKNKRIPKAAYLRDLIDRDSIS